MLNIMFSNTILIYDKNRDTDYVKNIYDGSWDYVGRMFVSLIGHFHHFLICGFSMLMLK